METVNANGSDIYRDTCSGKCEQELRAAEGEEQDFDDSVKRCPDCERPNQFGELCQSCNDERAEEACIDHATRRAECGYAQ